MGDDSHVRAEAEEMHIDVGNTHALAWEMKVSPAFAKALNAAGGLARRE